MFCFARGFLRSIFWGDRYYHRHADTASVAREWRASLDARKEIEDFDSENAPNVVEVDARAECSRGSLGSVLGTVCLRRLGFALCESTVLCVAGNERGAARKELRNAAANSAVFPYVLQHS